MRPRDEPIDGSEVLFRGARQDDVDGDRLMGRAIELPASSVVRSKYGNAEQAKDVQKQRTRVAAGRGEQIDLGPHPKKLDVGQPAWRILIADAPEEGDHHAEIRITEVDRDYDSARKPGSKPTKDLLRDKIAEGFRVFPDDGSAPAS